MVTQALLPNLAPGASIIHISSTRALQSEPHTEAYAAAKAGLLGLTHAQAISLAGTARVNAGTVSPGCLCLGVSRCCSRQPAGTLSNIAACLAAKRSVAFHSPEVDTPDSANWCSCLGLKK